MAVNLGVDDMDIDFDEDPEIARLQAEADALKRSRDEDTEAMNGVEEPPEDGEYDENAPAPNKVHLRGVDSLNTNHIREFVDEHYSMDLFQKIEWIDDTSVNLVYDTELAAAEALIAFSAEEVSEALQMRAAKRLFSHPETSLQVRQAVLSDIKAVNAKDSSRFYLQNPEWDPDNRTRKRRRPETRGYHSNKYLRRDWLDDQPERHARDISFTEDMYDEGPSNAEVSRRGSSYSDGESGRRRASYNERGDLLSGATNTRLRSRNASPRRAGDLMSRTMNARSYRQRSASPRRDGDLIRGTANAKFRERDTLQRRGGDLTAQATTARFRERSASPRRDGYDEGDGRYGFSEEQPRRRTPRPRSRTTSEYRPARNNSVVHDDSRKELFPDRSSSSAIANGDYQNGNTFRTPERPSSSANRELFPDRLNNSVHRRKDAKDIHPDEVADAFGKYTISTTREDERLAYDRPGLRPEHDNRGQNARQDRGGRDLFSRVSGGPTTSSESSYGRLHSQPPVQPSDNNAGFNIRGADAGFHIRGASKVAREPHPLVKELFPLKKPESNGGGKDLFDGNLKIKGRGAQRLRAEDF